MLRIIRIADIAKFIGEMIFLVACADYTGLIGVGGETVIAIEAPAHESYDQAPTEKEAWEWRQVAHGQV